MHALGGTLVVHFNGACGGLESKVQHKKQKTIPPDDAKAAKCTRMGGAGDDAQRPRHAPPILLLYVWLGSLTRQTPRVSTTTFEAGEQKF